MLHLYKNYMVYLPVTGSHPSIASNPCSQQNRKGSFKHLLPPYLTSLKNDFDDDDDDEGGVAGRDGETLCDNLNASAYKYKAGFRNPVKKRKEKKR